MSICTCDKCGEQIDSDIDVDCFGMGTDEHVMGSIYVTYCEQCRDKMEREEYEREEAAERRHEQRKDDLMIERMEQKRGMR